MTVFECSPASSFQMSLSVLCKASGIVGALFFTLIGICIFRVLILHEPTVLNYCNADEDDYFADKDGALKRLSKALQFQTVSYNHHNYEREALSKFVKYIFESELLTNIEIALYLFRFHGLLLY